jgi:hypothetical protein
MTTPCDVNKRREIAFHTTPPGQVGMALAFLKELPNLAVDQRGPLLIEVSYCVQEYTIEAIDGALSRIGCHLETSLLFRLRRALYYYVERIQRDNMALPEIHTKDYSMAHAEAWKKRLHGDHDDTPAEWRQYK